MKPYETITENAFFQLCCEKAKTEAGPRQARKFIKGEGAAAEYAIKTGNRRRIQRMAKKLNATRQA